MICEHAGWWLMLRIAIRIAAVSLGGAPGWSAVAAVDSPHIELLYGDHEIFPSALISLTDRSAFPPRIGQSGDPIGLISVVLIAPRDDSPVKVTLAATEIFGQSSISLILPNKGQRYRIAPYLLLDHEKMLRLKHPIPAEVLRATVDLDGKVETVSLQVSIHAINDSLMAARFGDKAVDTSYLGAAFVNENNPEVPTGVIRYALERGYVDRFVGYEGGRDGVKREVRAVFQSLRNLGFKFAATTRPSLATTMAGTQWVRLTSDSIRSDQANCIDGTVIFSSVLTALRLRVVMFVRPYQHAFMGVYLDPHDDTLGPDSVLVVETIRVGTADSFEQAVAAGRSLLNEHVGALAKLKFATVRRLSELRPADVAYPGTDGPKGGPKFIELPALYVIDIQDARLNRGIQPVPELMPALGWLPPLPSGTK